MPSLLKSIPTIRGVIDRRILANYRLDPGATAAQLPAPFRPKLVNGYAIGGLCLIRLRQVRPAFVPMGIGIRSENAAHRIAVEWDEDGQTREGVYIPRRDTDSCLNALAGGRLFPGVHHRSRFDVEEVGDAYAVGFTSRDGSCAMSIRARRAGALPPDSVFGDLASASGFFEAGSLGYSPDSVGRGYDGLVLDCASWSVEPLAVERVSSSYFDDADRFQPGQAIFDHALLMRGIDHRWHQAASMCCFTGGNG